MAHTPVEAEIFFEHREAEITSVRNNSKVRLQCRDILAYISKDSLVRLSAWFEIAIAVLETQGNVECAIAFPENVYEQFPALLQFLETPDYYVGPLQRSHGDILIEEPNERDARRGVDEATGFSIRFTSQDPQFLLELPELENQISLHGTEAMRAGQIIRCHPLSKDEHGAYQEISADSYECQIDLLHPQTQKWLVRYLKFVTTRDSRCSNDMVFHVRMYKIAVRYMIPSLGEAVLQTLLSAAKPWLLLADPYEYPFLLAWAEHDWPGPWLCVHRPDLDPKESAIDSLFVQIILSNWGWMQFDPAFGDFIQSAPWRIEMLQPIITEYDHWRQARRQWLEDYPGFLPSASMSDSELYVIKEEPKLSRTLSLG